MGKVSLPALNYEEESTENRAFFVAFGCLGGKMGAKNKKARLQPYLLGDGIC